MTSVEEGKSLRLLELFPLKVIKEEFSEKGNSSKDVLKKIARKNALEDLKEDCFRLFGYARQHIYFLNIDEKDMSLIKTDLIDGKTGEVRKHDSTQLLVEYMLDLDFTVVVIKNMTALRQKITFPWPIQIIATPGLLQVRMIVMEKDPKKHMDRVHKSFVEDRSIDEEYILKEVTKRIPSASIHSKYDLNKAVKHLWSEDVIDSRSGAAKKSKSTTSEVMDLGYFLKQVDPERAAEMMELPLRKQIFGILTDQTLPEYVTLDASAGFMAFLRFQTDPTAINRLIELVLSEN